MKIILFSGMDFSGKTTLINSLYREFFGFNIRHKFLTNIDPLRNFRNSNHKCSYEEWIEFWKNAIESDISKFRDESSSLSNVEFSILQDSLSAFKHYALLKTTVDTSIIPLLIGWENKLMMYPDACSIYLTISYEERMRRYNKRSSTDRTFFDTIVPDRETFEQIDCEYNAIVTKRYPDTLIIDGGAGLELSKLRIREFLY